MLGFATVVGTEIGAGDGVGTLAGGGVGVTFVRSMVGIWGVGEGAVERQIGVMGVESVSVSISEGMSGGGVVRLRTLVAFFFPLVFLGFLMFSGEGLAVFGVWIARVREWESLSSLAAWSDALV